MEGECGLMGEEGWDENTTEEREGRVWLRGEMAARRLLIAANAERACLFPHGPGASNCQFGSSAVLPRIVPMIQQWSLCVC